MTADEIRNQVLLGAHSEVKAFLAPIMVQVSEIVGSEFQVRYNGSGGILVMIEANPKTTAETWELIWKAARAVRAQLPEALKVSKPYRGGIDGGTFTITRDSFSITVRSANK